MKRLTLMALTPALALATPVVAQTKTEMSPQTVRYGPEETPVEKAKPQQRERSYVLGDIVGLPPAPDGNRLIAAEQLTPDAKLGLGFFRVITPDRPLSVDREPIVRSTIAAVGLAVKFKR